MDMMWTTQPENRHDWEPKELRMLKQQLANLTCKCSACERDKKLSRYKRFHSQIDKEIQAESQNGRFNLFVQDPVYNLRNYDISKSYNEMLNSFRKDFPCPSCFLTMNLLRGVKVLKDEESETKTEMFSCDKSTGKGVKSLEKTTSMTNKPALKYSNLSFYDYISESTDVTNIKDSSKRSNEVNFLNVWDKEQIDSQNFSIIGNCFCLESFMDTIRPPMPDMKY